MIELYILFADSDRYKYWNTYENDHSLVMALDKIEAEQGQITNWYVKYLTDECL